MKMMRRIIIFEFISFMSFIIVHSNGRLSTDENVKQTDTNFRTKTFLTIQDIHSLIDIYFH